MGTKYTICIDLSYADMAYQRRHRFTTHGPTPRTRKAAGELEPHPAPLVPQGTDFSKVTSKRLRKVEGHIIMYSPSLDGLTAEQKERELYHVA